jgi:hypothetical protein
VLSDAVRSDQQYGGRPGTRTRMSYPTRPSNVRVYLFRQPPVHANALWFRGLSIVGGFGWPDGGWMLPAPRVLRGAAALRGLRRRGMRLADGPRAASRAVSNGLLPANPMEPNRCESVVMSDHPTHSHQLPGGGPGLTGLRGAGFLLCTPRSRLRGDPCSPCARRHRRVLPRLHRRLPSPSH